jgi:hypothetical protein
MEPAGGDSPKPASFPLNTLPSPVRRFAEEAGKTNRVPPDFVAVPALAAAGIAIGHARVLEIKPGWEFKPNLFAAVVAPPGSAKTPAQNAALAPLEKAQVRYAQQHETQKLLHKQHLEEWMQQKKDERGEKPEPPRMKEILVKDTTIEALVEALQHNPHGLLVAPDELSAWVLAMNQYRQGKGADRQHFLTLWTGVSLKVNRKGKDPVLIPCPVVSVIGGIPPTVLHRIMDEVAQEEDGLLHRILFSCQDSPVEFWSDDMIDKKIWRDYYDIFDALLNLMPQIDGLPETVTLSPEAKEVWVRHYDRNAAATKHFADTFSPLRGVWAKMPSQAARIALILHCCKYVIGEAENLAMDTNTIEEAWKIIDYFKSHARLVYREFRKTPEQRRADMLLGWIKKKGGKTTIRDIYTDNIAGCQTSADALQLIDALQRGKLVRKTSEKGARGPAKEIVVLTEEL